MDDELSSPERLPIQRLDSTELVMVEQMLSDIKSSASLSCPDLNDNTIPGALPSGSSTDNVSEAIVSSKPTKSPKYRRRSQSSSSGAIPGVMKEFQVTESIEGGPTTSDSKIPGVLDNLRASRPLTTPVDLDNLPFSSLEASEDDSETEDVRSSPTCLSPVTVLDLRHSLSDITQLRALIATGVSVNAPIKEEHSNSGGLERWRNVATTNNTQDPVPDWRTRAMLASCRSVRSCESICSAVTREIINEGEDGNRLRDPLPPLQMPDDKDAEVEFGTLLHCVAADATLENSSLITAELIAAKASVNARSSAGSTPLMRAAAHKNIGVAEVLLANRANLEPMDNLCQSALHCAIHLTYQEKNAGKSAKAETASKRLVELLLLNKADPISGVSSNSPTPEPISPGISSKEVEQARSCWKSEIVPRLDNSATSVEPLLFAIRNCNAPVVSCLLHHGAFAKFLHEAVVVSCPAVIRELLKAQADPSASNSEGLSPMELAYRRTTEQDAVTNLLRTALAQLDLQRMALSSMKKKIDVQNLSASSGSLPSISVINASPRSRPNSSLSGVNINSLPSVAGSRRPSYNSGGNSGSRRGSHASPRGSRDLSDSESGAQTPGGSRRPSFSSIANFFAGSRRPSIQVAEEVAEGRRPSELSTGSGEDGQQPTGRRPSCTGSIDGGLLLPPSIGDGVLSPRRPSLGGLGDARRPSLSVIQDSIRIRRPSVASIGQGSTISSCASQEEPDTPSSNSSSWSKDVPGVVVSPSRRCSKASIHSRNSAEQNQDPDSPRDSVVPVFNSQRRLSKASLFSKHSAVSSVQSVASRESYLSENPRGSKSLRTITSGKTARASEHDHSLSESTVSWFYSILGALQPHCSDLSRSKWFQASMFMVLMAALFTPDFWVLLDLDSTQGLDAILLCLLGLFAIEIVVQSIASPKRYVGSFFFYMDVLGTVSILLDVSYTNPFEGHAEGQNLVVMRIARLAKLGARAGRFTRLVKLFRFLPGMQQQNKERIDDVKTARVISNQTNTALSTRVSFLIVVMVIALPTFDIERYPQVDHSMRHWVNEMSFAVDDARGSEEITELLSQFGKFYSNLNYFPYQLRAKFPNNTDAFSWSFAAAPKQIYNAVRVSSDSGRVQAWFDFRSPRQIDAGMNVLLIVFVILLMIGFSLVLSNSVSRIVLQPLEHLLSYLRNATSTIFKSVTDMTNKLVEDEQEEMHGRRVSDEAMAVDALGAETELLVKVVEKLAVMSEINMKKRALKDETKEDLLACCLLPGQPSRESLDENETSFGHVMSTRSSNASSDQEARMALHQHLLTTVGLDVGVILSWRFNALETNDKQNHVAIFSMLKCTRKWESKVDEQITSNFIAAASAGYNKQVPYHNWAHAVDVVHAVYQFSWICEAHRFLNGLELFSLLVAAAGHDLGHFGFNNPYLTEISHALALRYNDISPLENMHCTKLFEILRNPKNDVFAGLDKQEQKDVRSVIIDSILHTDMVHHNSMVQDLQVLHEMNSGALTSRDMAQRAEVFAKSKPLMRRLFLHAADISNPVKPFAICKRWAHLILDEFFSQGDAEKEAGVPVQMLNDRDKVNRPNSQIGFIEFLVAPLFFVSAQLLPDLGPLAVTCVENAQHWANEWQMTKFPKPSEDEVKGVQDRVGKLVDRLRERLGLQVLCDEVGAQRSTVRLATR